MEVTRVQPGRPSRTTSGTRTTGWESRVKRRCADFMSINISATSAYATVQLKITRQNALIETRKPLTTCTRCFGSNEGQLHYSSKMRFALSLSHEKTV